MAPNSHVQPRQRVRFRPSRLPTLFPPPNTNTPHRQQRKLGRLLDYVAEYGHFGLPIPYGSENEALNPSTLSEDVFKQLRGSLTEGRYLVFEMNGYALTNPSANASDFTATKATSNHEDKKHRWVIRQTGGAAVDGGAGAGRLTISSALDARYVKSHTSLRKGASGAETYIIADLGNVQRYTLVKENEKYLTVDENGAVDIIATPTGFQFL